MRTSAEFAKNPMGAFVDPDNMIVARNAEALPYDCTGALGLASSHLQRLMIRAFSFRSGRPQFTGASRADKEGLCGGSSEGQEAIVIATPESRIL